MKTYSDREKAINAMRDYNISHKQGDGKIEEYTVMSLGEAIESDFAYCWEG